SSASRVTRTPVSLHSVATRQLHDLSPFTLTELHYSTRISDTDPRPPFLVALKRADHPVAHPRDEREELLCRVEVSPTARGHVLDSTDQSDATSISVRRSPGALCPSS